jgi:eukaryotic-like serine/threonine-protein kinase
MLSGRPPFRAANTVAVLKRVVEDTPRPIPEIIPEVPSWMCELIGHLHAKNPDDRYGSAKEVSELLAQCASDLQAGRNAEDPQSVENRADPSPQGVSVNPVPRRESLLHSPLIKAAAVVVMMLAVAGHHRGNRRDPSRLDRDPADDWFGDAGDRNGRSQS